MDEPRTHYDKIKHQLLDKKWVAFLLLAGVVIIGLASLSDALAKLSQNVRAMFPQASGAVASSSPGPPQPQGPVLIVTQDGADPRTQGFDVYSDPINSSIVQNEHGSGYDRRQIRTDDQNHYFRRLQPSEKERAYKSGWTLRCRMKAEEGIAEAGAEFGTGFKRFDVWLFRDRGQPTVGLPTRITPYATFYEKYTFARNEQTDYADMELRFDPTVKTADLYVNNQLRISGYPGWDQYNDMNQGLFFGAFKYNGSATGSATFKLVSFAAP